jgi:hypothetical protein
MTTLTPDTLLIRNPDLIATDMDGDTVMMSIERGEYFGIGGVGSRVWALLAQPVSIAQITTSICAKYEVDAATCQTDMQKFAQELLQSGLVSRA